MAKRNQRFEFDDWRDWFEPKTYGVGWTVKSWKGVAAVGLGILFIVLITFATMHFLSKFIT